MKTYQVVVETDNAHQTISKIESLLSEGFKIKSAIDPSSRLKGKLGTYISEAETSELALNNAIRIVKRDRGEDKLIVPEEIVEARMDCVTIFAFNEERVREEIGKGQIQEIKLIKLGWKGLWGIGKKPNEYQVRIIRPAKVVVGFSWNTEGPVIIDIEPESVDGVFYFFESKPFRHFGCEETFDLIYYEAQKCDPDWVFDSNHNTFIYGHIDVDPKFQHNIELTGHEGLNPLQKLKLFLEEKGWYGLNTENLDVNRLIPKYDMFHDRLPTESISEAHKKYLKSGKPKPIYVIGFGGKIGLYQVKELNNVILKNTISRGYLGYVTSTSLESCAFHLHLLKDDHLQQLKKDSITFEADLKEYAKIGKAKITDEQDKPDFYLPSVVNEMKTRFLKNGFELKDKTN